MSTPAEKMVLNEVDAEGTLLGSLFMAPQTFDLASSAIRPEWFSDSMLRYIFESSRKIIADGHAVTPKAVVAALPEDCGGIPRGTLYARICAAAMPVNAIPSLASVLRDRWARRELVAAADDLKARAQMFGESPFDLAGEAIIALDGVSVEAAGSSVRTIDAAMDGVGEAKHVRRGATTGLYALDNKLNGYVPGQLYVIAGRPGMGKSAFMCSSLRRTAQSGKGVAIFSLEMGADEIAARCMADTLDTPHAPGFGDILRGGLTNEQRADVTLAKDSLSGIPLYIDDAGRLTLSEIEARAKQVKATFEASGVPLAVVCIDHMGLVEPPNRYAGNKVAEAGQVSNFARTLAKKLGCCVVLLCQLSREVEKREGNRPTMADLRWSGEIEQDAHVVAFLFREHYYLANDPNALPYQLTEAKNKLEFLIRKNRNGETADIHLWCSMKHSAIRDNAQEDRT